MEISISKELGKDTSQEPKEEPKVEEIIPEKEEPKVEEPKEEEKETLEGTLDLLFKATQINTTLIWMAATMSLIAAINSLTGQTVLIKGTIFMVIGLVSLVIYKRRLKK